jgi:nucleoside-diphosphate-sugar epimerase
MANILVTGGAGFIASAMAAKLAANPDHRVVIADNLLSGSMRKVPVSVHKNIRFTRCDVNQLPEITEVFHSLKFDYVFHYAAMVGVQRTLNKPVSVLADIEGIKNILNLSKATAVRRIYYSSSSEVYGEPVHIPQNEHTTPLNSRLPYAIVKNIGEAFLKAYREEYGLEYTVFRFFNTYGPFQSEDFVIARFLERALKGEDITIYGDGTQTRTFCYIDDNTEACEKIFANELHVNDVINIGSDIETTILDLALLITRLANSPSRIVHLPPLPEGDMTRRKPDITKMNAILEKPLINLEEGISRIIHNRGKN